MVKISVCRVELVIDSAKPWFRPGYSSWTGAENGLYFKLEAYSRTRTTGEPCQGRNPGYGLFFSGHTPLIRRGLAILGVEMSGKLSR